MTGFIRIPPQQLPADVLQAVIEAFITREGTDYGLYEYSLEEKVEQLRAQLQSGEVVLVFDPESESCTLIPREQA